MHSRPAPLSLWKSHRGSVSFQVNTIGTPAWVMMVLEICAPQVLSKQTGSSGHHARLKSCTESELSQAGVMTPLVDPKSATLTAIQSALSDSALTLHS